ncbi:MAG TPA: GtrA family protein [Rhizomicrobium sp.]
MSWTKSLARLSFVRFAIIGGLGFVVDSAVLAADTNWLGLDPFKGRILSIFCAMVCTWLGNRYFTFSHKRARGSVAAIFHEASKFAATNMVGAVVNYGVYAALLYFAHPPYNNKYAALVAGVLAGLVFNFTLSRKLVFTGRTPPL